MFSSKEESAFFLYTSGLCILSHAFLPQSRHIKKNPQLYQGIESSTSWILNEPFIFDYFQKLDRTSRVLDVGCGNGNFLNRIKEIGFSNSKGADIGNYLNDKSQPHESIDINVERFEDADESFDIVTAFQVLEHLENYFLILQEAQRILKKDGLFIFSVPNHLNIF